MLAPPANFTINVVMALAVLFLALAAGDSKHPVLVTKFVLPLAPYAMFFNLYEFSRYINDPWPPYVQYAWDNLMFCVFSSTLLVLLLFRRAKMATIKEAGGYKRMFAFTMVCWVLVFGIQLYFRFLEVTPTEQNLEGWEIFNHDIAAAIAEECVYRCAWITAIAGVVGRTTKNPVVIGGSATIISSLVWTVVHVPALGMDIPRLASIFVCGCVYGVCFIAGKRNPGPGFIVHVANNAFGAFRKIQQLTAAMP